MKNRATYVCNRVLFHYTVLFFGVSSAPEKYQKVTTDILRGVPRVANIADDLVVYSKDIEEHDGNLFALLQQLKDKCLTFNSEKCQFHMSGLTCFKHKLSSDGFHPVKKRLLPFKMSFAKHFGIKIISWISAVLLKAYS